MGYKVHFSKVALLEFYETYDYYYEIHPSIALKFDTELNHNLDVLEVNPYFEKRYNGYRFSPLFKFPYLLIFEIDEKNKEVEIKALFHTSQDTLNYPI